MDKVASLIPRNRTSQRRKPFEKKEREGKVNHCSSVTPG